ncbi:hypothetical protein NKH36_00010 [Mesorhizobium sp. M1312]|uniref:hypothetical protein n=1 Tax=unclassified Mesorhizobium TaxID=325217 RepID=UPI00333AB05B
MFDEKKINRIIARTARRISSELDRMRADLPEEAAPQMALELVLRRLVPLQPAFMTLIMEHEDFREAFESALSMIPASKGATYR